MGNIVNRSDSEEVDSINHLLWWSLGGTALFLFTVCVYYFARPQIDSFIQNGFNWDKSSSSTQVQETELELEEPVSLESQDTAPAQGTESSVQYIPLEAETFQQSTEKDGSHPDFGKPRGH